MAQQRNGKETGGNKPSLAQGSLQPVQPPPQRRTSSSMPGLSSVASQIRNRRSSYLPYGSSLSRGPSVPLAAEDDSNDDDDDDDDANTHGSVDAQQLEELRKGIIMPGLGGNRANTEEQLASGKAAVASASSAQKNQYGNTSSTNGAKQSTALAKGPASDSPSSLANITASATHPRSRTQATLKASMLKKRLPSTSSVPLASATSSAGKKSSSSGTKIGQGTPARTTRYSLPVRADKPVRTSKTTGKHVVLPSESQLAPLPDEEEDEEDEEDEEESSDDESDDEVASKADDEQVPEHLDEEAREEAQKALKRRKEEAQRRIDEARKERAAKRHARKTEGDLGHIDSTLPARGPAHARAPPRVPKSSGPVYHTFERLAPAARVHTPLPRLTSYALAPAFHIPTLNGFLRREHGVKPRLYDECAYVVYFKPLLPGFGRALVRTSPEPHTGSPGAESRREREIVEREESGYVGSYFVANNNKDEEDIDEQGYIHGGEGQSKEEAEQETEERERRRRHETSLQLGEVTETDGENERDGDGHRSLQDRADLDRADESQTETETEMGLRDDLSPHELHKTSPQSASSALNDTLSEEEGIRTPRALKPTQEKDNDILIDESTELDKSMEAASLDELSNADIAGAQDLRQQQFMIEQGTSDPQGLPAMRSESADSDHENSSLSNRQRSANMEQTNSSNGRRDKRDRDERRRARKKQKQLRNAGPNMASHHHDGAVNILAPRSILEALQIAELVILPYGVLVMYNFTAAEERDIISDVLSSGCVRGGPANAPDDEETEAFHFCYDPSVPAPRIFNDFFTFRGPNHLLKLSLAHAIAQSTKLSVFEESMQRTLELTSHIPKELASSGELHLKRREALRLTGRLFHLRVDVNLTSNVLDTPELFWSEASLKALYDAIREYLEIDQRVENLNERLAVGNDLLEVIHDHLGSQSMNQITWIIIILIVVACIVACGEISARLVLHSRVKSEALRGTTAVLKNSTYSMTGTATLRKMYYDILAAKTFAEVNGAQVPQLPLQ